VPATSERSTGEGIPLGPGAEPASHPARDGQAEISREDALRYLYVGLIVVFTAFVALFTIQNLPTVTISLLFSSMTLPLSVLVIVIYILGMLTGGSVLALLRTGILRARGDR
jgi:uncharacterized integral membrane protein